VSEDRASTAVALARALAGRMAEVVPEEVVVAAHRSTVSVELRGDQESIDIEPVVDQAGDPTENIEAAAFMVLSGVQDLISESTATPWPPVVDANGRALPYPHADVVMGELLLSFGDPENPALVLRSIPLAELRGE
jgi:hypothetical protein